MRGQTPERDFDLGEVQPESSIFAEESGSLGACVNRADSKRRQQNAREGQRSRATIVINSTAGCALRKRIPDAFNASNTGQRQQRDQSPDKGCRVVLQRRQEGPEGQVCAACCQQSGSREAPAADSNRAFGKPALRASRRHQRDYRQPVKQRLMVGQPWHPGVRWSLYESAEGIRQVGQKTIERHQEEVRPGRELQQRVDGGLQRQHAHYTGAARRNLLRLSASLITFGKLLWTKARRSEEHT